MTTIRSRWAIWMLGAVLVAVVLWLVYEQVSVRYAANNAQQQATSLAEQVAEACAHGGAVAAQLGPACEQANRVQQAIPGPPGATGPSGPPGPKGDKGDPGMGATGPSGPPGAAVTGAPGQPGTDGKNGVDGQSPPCLAEPDRCHGADGKDGKDGAPGPKGDAGAPGPTCPTGYEPRPAVITAPDGSTYQGVACVKPDTSQPPSTTSPPILGGTRK